MSSLDLNVLAVHIQGFLVDTYKYMKNIATLRTPEPGVDPEFIEINTQEESGKNHAPHL